MTAFRNEEVSRIILTRPAIEAGEKLGFLPGDLQSKVDPYLRPLYDALYQIMGADSFAKNMERGLIEVAPLAYMRGRTLDNAFIILDEAQNTTPAQMKMFLTRIGFGSKVVVTGDASQKDLPRDAVSGLDVAAKVLKKIDDIGFCTLTSKDVDGRIHPARIEEMVEKAQKEVEAQIREDGENAAMDVGVHGIHPELLKLLGRMKFRSSYGQNALKHSIEVAQLSGILAGEIGVDVRMAKRAGLLHDIGKSIDHEVEGSHIQIGVDLCKKYKESAVVINTVASHHGDCEPESLVACIVQAADAISAARPGARRETLETYTNRLKQLEDITNEFKGVEKSFAIQAGREIRVMVVPEHVTDADMVLLARDIAKQIEAELEYPGQIKVNVIRESRAVDYAK